MPALAAAGRRHRRPSSSTSCLSWCVAVASASVLIVEGMDERPKNCLVAPTAESAADDELESVDDMATMALSVAPGSGSPDNPAADRHWRIASPGHYC